MTQLEFEWGAPIPTLGRKKPDWLRDEVFSYRTIGDKTDGWLFYASPGQPFYWPNIEAIRLASDHPFYFAAVRGFTYWPGGDAAPGDWDGGYVLLRDGYELLAINGERWTHIGHKHDIVGYQKKGQPTASKAPPKMIDHIGGFINPNLGPPDKPRDWSLDRREKKAPPKMIDHGPDPLPLGPNDPPGWAVVRAWNEVGGLVTPRSAILALARYIERHEKPPVDPDVLAVRAILAAYAARWGGVEEATQISGGLNDDGPGFQAALETYRTIKANGGVPDVSSS